VSAATIFIGISNIAKVKIMKTTFLNRIYLTVSFKRHNNKKVWESCSELFVCFLHLFQWSNSSFLL
ncbi:MAG: hypothetical protein ACTSSK_07965, partial [Candidatus Heimdallarchaeota archaeon]